MTINPPPTTLSKFRARLLALLALSLASLASGAAQTDHESAFAAALADLIRARKEAATVGTTVARAAEASDAPFSRMALESLEPREIAELVRWRAFEYSAASPARARIASQRLDSPSAAADIDGALALTLRVMLSSAAGIKGQERADLIKATLRHPAYVALLQSDYGDLALDAACRAGLRDETHRDLVLGLAGKLDATKSTAAANAVGSYWNKIEQAIPEGESRQAARRQLSDYLGAVLAKDDRTLGAERRDKIEAWFAKLNSAAARGEKLEGKPAPELHFLWASEGGWKSLSDLRGKVVVLDFWATWCGACIESLPHVAKLAERYRGTDVVIVGVTSLQGAVFNLTSRSVDCRGDPEKEIRLTTDFLKAKAITWPVVFSREPVINPDYGVDGIPTMVLIAPDGTVRHKTSGSPEASLIAQIDAVLKEFQLKAPASGE